GSPRPPRAWGDRGGADPGPRGSRAGTALGAPRALGRALRTLGLIEGGDEGVERIRESVDLLKDSPARLEHAYALTDRGAALRRGNRRAEARDHLRQALELAQRLGAALLGEQAYEKLVATGARPRRL